MEKETRNYEIEIRTDQDKNIVEGYALKFNTESRDLGGFTESILPEAIEGVLKNSDVLAVLNHNEDKAVFARSRFGKGSLHLEVDEVGLRYWWKIGKSATHQDLQEMIERGDIFSSSFAFTLPEGGDTWEKRNDGKYLRTILKFDQFFDVSPVYRPAYESTSVGTRAQEKVAELRKEDENTSPTVEVDGLDDVKAMNDAIEIEFKNYMKKLKKQYLSK